ncbi:hypothetical protein [Acidithiobacillus thiooxidans]|uniref:Uncharacterized protein n=1 Tax=Acidithiobacillus thiooxidans TaxID=930 RepID=A0A1C2J1X3_ACITH|nr:hypothetical protein [Acidithiobacillus thiooxidans]OCX68840.1 hypothetical protein A6M23_17125 [Acidithiobacillus thiooxidans]OCX82270.1 hypothetical protein A6P08_12520 [Acidithiobacillus thiooxidans]
MPEHTGLPAIPALDAGQEDWILAWRKALGAYAVMAGVIDHLTERWTQEMAQAYLAPFYPGDSEDLANIRATAQQLGPLSQAREKIKESTLETAPRPATHEKSKQDAEAQLDMFAELL